MLLSELQEKFNQSSKEDWYRLVIDLGRKLPAIPAEYKKEDNKVHGCQSQVWLWAEWKGEEKEKLQFYVDSDALIVKGLLAILMMLYNQKTPEEILKTDKEGLKNLGLTSDYFSPTRMNGLSKVLEQIYRYSQAFYLLKNNP